MWSICGKLKDFLYKTTTVINICSIFVQTTKGKMNNMDAYISSAEVKKMGRAAYYRMLERARRGELIQVRRGVYADIEQLSAGMVDIGSIVPGGILCLWSAWSIHRLTTSMPQAYHVAVKRGRKLVTAPFPQIELHYYTASIWELGVSRMFVDGRNVNVYDMERSVCDAVKFRNKIGIDVCSEIIDNYLARPERNISKLLNYARQLRVGKILETYLQVKL